MQIKRWAGNAPGADPSRCVLVLPGRAYPVEMPGLALPLRALALNGWTIWHAAWELDDLDEVARRAVVVRAVAELDQQTAASSQRVVLGKSLGTYAAGWAADNGVPAIGLTPLLIDQSCAEDITRSTAPAMLVAGTADLTWDDAAAERTGKQIVRLAGADHGFQTGDWRAEVEILREVAEAVEAFARALSPGAPASL
jgi:hypothetical protein